MPIVVGCTSIALAVSASAVPAPVLVEASLPATLGDGFLGSSFSLGRTAFLAGVTFGLPLVVYPFLAGAAARSATLAPRPSTLALIAVAVALAAVGVPVLRGTTDPRALFAVAATSIVGVLAGPRLASWVAPGWLRRLEERTRSSLPLRVLLAVPLAHATAALLLGLYAACLFALWLACVMTILVVLVRGVLHILFGPSGGRVRRESSDPDGSRHAVQTEDGVVVATTDHQKGIFGGESTVERDGSGRVTAVSRKVEPWFGEPYWERRDADGRLLSTEQRERDWITGESRSVLRDASRNVIGQKAWETPILGEAGLVTRDARGEVVASEHARTDWLGERIVVTEDSSGQVVGTTRADPGLFDPTRTRHEGKSAADLLAERREEDESP